MAEFLKIILFSVVLIGLAVAGLAISILVKKGGRFPDTHISSNKKMKERGIHCAEHEDKREQAGIKKKITFRNVTMVREREE